jgi:hypothetical protein
LTANCVCGAGNDCDEEEIEIVVFHKL